MKPPYQGELAATPGWARAARRAVTAGRTARWRARGGPRGGTAGFRVLLYHRIADDRDPLAVPVGRFEEQAALLASGGHRVVTVAEALRAGSGTGLVALSFDDGYQDLAEHALPVLRRHGFHASVFVATGLVDGRTSATWYLAGGPAVLDWSAVRALDTADELEFEAHSVNHRDLLRLSDASARYEIEASRSELAEQLGRSVGGFSYPAGRYAQRELRLVAAAGFEYAVTCDPGLNTRETNRYAVRRIEVLGSDTLRDFEARLGGGHDEPMPFRGAYRRIRYGARPPSAA